MHNSRSIDKMNPKQQSNLFVNALVPILNFHNPHKDPFDGLTFKGKVKLLPVSPSGIQLPRIQTSMILKSPKNVLSAKNLTFLTPKNEKLKNLSSFKPEKKFLLIPKTPKVKRSIRNSSTTNAEILFSRKKIAQPDFIDVSFGNNN